MEHERMRFKTLKENQLWTRLGRITQQEKLSRFAIVAAEYGYYGLQRAASEKMIVLIKTKKEAKFTQTDTVYMTEEERLQREIINQARKRWETPAKTKPEPTKPKTTTSQPAQYKRAIEF